MSRASALSHRSRWLIPAIVVIFLFLSTVTVYAAPSSSGSLQEKFRSGNDITIPAGETVPHDLYLAGNTVRVDGTIDGDLVVAGGTIIVNGTVTGGVIATGGNVALNGPVGRQVRVWASSITIGGPVGGDVVATGGQMTATAGSHIKGDLVYGGGPLTLSGPVDGSVFGRTAQYRKTGSIGGTEQVTIPQNAPPSVWEQVRSQIERYAIMLLFGLLLLWFAPRLIRAVTATVGVRPLPSLGRGLIAVVAAVVLVVALFVLMFALAIPLGLLGLGQLAGIVVVGAFITIAALLFALTVFSAFLADALVGFAVGGFLLTRVRQPWARHLFWHLLLGATLIFALTLIPFVGGFLQFLAVIAGAGMLVNQVIAQRRNATAVPPVGPQVGPLVAAPVAGT
jgi:cytoskeletal protein CcmA (bactofilin family)